MVMNVMSINTKTDLFETQNPTNYGTTVTCRFAFHLKVRRIPRSFH